MGEGLVVSGSDAYVEELGDGGEVLDRGRSEVPVGEGLFGEVAGVGSAVAAKDLGGVVGGVEADAEEMGTGVEGGIGGEGFVDLGEVATHARAEVGERAAGIDEGDEEDFAFELLEVDGAVALVEKFEVGDAVAGLGDVVLDGWLVVGASLSDDYDFVEFGVAIACGILFDEDFGGDTVAGVEFAYDAGVLELVGHDHGVHKAGDGLVVERDVSGIGADDLASDGKGLLLEVGDRRGRGGGLAATGEQDSEESEE